VRVHRRPGDDKLLGLLLEGDERGVAPALNGLDFGGNAASEGGYADDEAAGILDDGTHMRRLFIRSSVRRLIRG
jgi:hypothetical protein